MQFSVCRFWMTHASSFTEPGLYFVWTGVVYSCFILLVLGSLSVHPTGITIVVLGVFVCVSPLIFCWSAIFICIRPEPNLPVGCRLLFSCFSSLAKMIVIPSISFFYREHLYWWVWFVNTVGYSLVEPCTRRSSFLRYNHYNILICSLSLLFVCSAMPQFLTSLYFIVCVLYIEI